MSPEGPEAGVSWTVDSDQAGRRLDIHVAEHRGEPRNQVQRWIREAHVLVNGAVVRPSLSLRGGEVIECSPPPTSSGGPAPQPGEIDILYEDADVIVVNKTAGVVIHPGAGREEGTLVNHLLARYPEIAGVGSVERPGIVHRLDVGTTGSLVVARSRAAYQELSLAFQERRVRKGYLAIVFGDPDPSSGTIDRPIARHRTQRRKMAVVAGGREAITHYRRLGTSNGVSLLSIGLETGRTHQIRVHLKSRGLPLVGDPLYGEARWKAHRPPAQAALRDFPRPALHSWVLEVRHPVLGTPLRIEAPPPSDLVELWRSVSGQALSDLLVPGDQFGADSSSNCFRSR